MKANADVECCPRFDPAPWDDQVHQWKNKPFVKDRVRCFLHVPLNFGAVVKRNMAAIQAAGVEAPQGVMLSDEHSPWSTDLYIEVAREVPALSTIAFNGTFMTKVFEGPYKQVRSWYDQMRVLVAARGRSLQHLYAFYTTCPRCAKKYGKNYVVMVAQV